MSIFLNSARRVSQLHALFHYSNASDKCSPFSVQRVFSVGTCNGEDFAHDLHLVYIKSFEGTANQK